MSLREDVEKLIEIQMRRLQKLKEQEALRGINSPPELLIEIEDLEAKIEQIQASLAEVKTQEAAQWTKIFILGDISGVWRLGSYEKIADYRQLMETLAKVHRPDEALFADLDEFLHDNIDIRIAVTENQNLPHLAGIAFVNTDRGAAEIINDIGLIRQYLPLVIFVLYTNTREYKRLQKTTPTEWAAQFEHYYKLSKGHSLTFETELREILDTARKTAVQRRDAHP